MKQIIYLAGMATLIASTAGIAYAATSAENDALALESAKINMTQAVAAAEQHVGGKAVHADFEKHNGLWVFEVEVVKGKKVMDVNVDASSGKVIAAVEDKNDHDDEQERKD